MNSEGSRIQAEPRVIVALDYPQAAPALEFVARVQPDLCKLKVGKELFVAEGPRLVEQLVGRGFDVFLDLKFHDIPNTVAQACKTAASLGVWLTNVHASGGLKMMAAAREALEGLAKRPKLIAVTVLTSMDAEQLHGIGIDADPQQQVSRLARLTQQAGLDGVVCSAQEAAMLRRELGKAFMLVTPGIRPAGSSSDDQTRIMTPATAIQAGADYLVIGRPITQATDPVAVLQTIATEISGVN
ncbi:MAG: orotidine-5'-phosphate decarboxylase [Hydrogenophilaceae bacterium]|nr:orotidine-5'-phosphate decarboxylase [Hydrogenophilaceae bacterium]